MKKLLILILISIATICLFAHNTTAQTMVTISGRLKDKYNNSIQAMIITYEQGTSNIINSIQTNSTGDYFFSLPGGIYDIQINLTSFSISNYSIKLLSVNLTEDIKDLIRYLNYEGGKVFFALDTNYSKKVEVYSIKKPLGVKLNGIKIPSWYYNETSKILTINIIEKMTLPLHVDGKYIKDSFNNTVYLRGVWTGWFLDTSTGWFDLNYRKWNEIAVRIIFQKLHDEWGVNVINFFIWGDWWLENKAITLKGETTEIGLRDAVKRTVEIAEYGIYVQVRLYAPTRAENRREGFPFQPTYNWTVQDFVNFWVNVSLTLKNYPNVIYCLFDEPTTPSGYTIWDYFNACNQTINAIRANGDDNIILIHWSYCDSRVKYVKLWIDAGYPTHNIVFSKHIYRYHGTFDGNPNSPVDIEYIKAKLNYTDFNENYGYKYIMDTYNVPIWVSAIGAYNGATDDSEYVYLWNTLEVLNEWEIGYVLYNCGRTNTIWTGLQNPEGELWSVPNRIGQALIDAIKGIPPPPTYTLTINSSPLTKIRFSLNEQTKQTPYTSGLFGGTYNISVPQIVHNYTHHPVFGNTEIEMTGGYSIYLHTAGPFTINESVNVSVINYYAAKPGKVKLAIYNGSYYSIQGWPDMYHPTNLIVQSSEYQCESTGWHSIPIPQTTLQPGTYFIVIKIDTNGMLGGVEVPWTGQYITSDYSEPFPNPFGQPEWVEAFKIAVYVLISPMEVYNYTFKQWGDGLTNSERTINLTTNTVLIATYELSG